MGLIETVVKAADTVFLLSNKYICSDASLELSLQATHPQKEVLEL